MAEKLLKYYKFVLDQKGLQGKMQLAMKTGVPSAKAALTPDSPDMLKKFEVATQQITGKTLEL